MRTFRDLANSPQQVEVAVGSTGSVTSRSLVAIGAGMFLVYGVIGTLLGYGVHYLAARNGMLVQDPGALRWALLFGGFLGIVGSIGGVIYALPEVLQTSRRGKAVDQAKGLAMPALIAALSQKDPYVRYGASFVLMKKGVEARPATAALLGSLRDPERRVRQNCAVALLLLAEAKALEAAAAVPAMTAALSDADDEVRKLAAMGLRAFGPGAAASLTALRGRLADANGHVRGLAARAIAAIGSAGATAVGDLVRLLADRKAQTDAAEALVALRSAAPQEVDRLAGSALPEAVKPRTCEICGATYRFSEGHSGYWLTAHGVSQKAHSLIDARAVRWCPDDFKKQVKELIEGTLKSMAPNRKT